MKRIFMYNKAIVYIGNLDKNSLAESINEVLNNLPTPIVRLTRQEEILVYSFDNNNILTINLNFYIMKDVLTSDEVNSYLNEVQTSLDNTIKTELREQKLIFTLE